MKVLGITAEYDPFHNGHSYHLRTAKEKVDPDVSICVMSGDFTQRGHVAVLDKWTRSKVALDHGLDMVLELPFLFAVSPAENFAKGAVDILLNAGATHISFGCEAEDPENLIKLAELQISKKQEIEDMIRDEMKSGISYVKARQIASSRILGEELTILSLTPNNILAIEYLKRMKYWEERGIKLEPVPVLRKGSGYKEVGPCNSDDDCWRNMAGGSAIRTMINAGWDVSRFLPYEQSSLAVQSPSDEVNTSVDAPVSPWIDADGAKATALQLLKVMAIKSDAEDFARIRFVSEGIENRLKREIIDGENYDQLLDRMTSKRYTSSTIRRMLICILMSIKKEEADLITCDEEALYGRILALGEKGRRLISYRKDNQGRKLPFHFISNVNKTQELPENAIKCLEIDIKAADMYNLITGKSLYQDSDHRQKPAIGC